MRSSIFHCIPRSEVYRWALSRLLEARLLKDHGRLCTAVVVLSLVLRAAARSISVCAACRDLKRAPSDDAALTAIEEELPKTWLVLEDRLNEALVGNWSNRLRRNNGHERNNLHERDWFYNGLDQYFVRRAR